MKIVIRIIGIATSIFWIFLVIFSVSALYSMKDLQFNFGQPQTSLTAENEMLFSLPVTIVNKGFYDLDRFTVTTEILDGTRKIAAGSTLIPVIRHGESVNVTHDMKLNLTSLFLTQQSYLFNDTELNMNATIGMSAANIIPIQAVANSSLPWGAPFHNFVLERPQFAAHNSTHFKATVDLSFENHAFFDLSGTVQAQMYDNAGTFMSQGQSDFEAHQNSPWHGTLELYVPMVGSASGGQQSSGYFEIFLSTRLFDYGPLVIPFVS